MGVASRCEHSPEAGQARLLLSKSSRKDAAPVLLLGLNCRLSISSHLCGTRLNQSARLHSVATNVTSPDRPYSATIFFIGSNLLLIETWSSLLVSNIEWCMHNESIGRWSSLAFYRTALLIPFNAVSNSAQEMYTASFTRHNTQKLPPAWWKIPITLSCQLGCRIRWLHLCRGVRPLQWGYLLAVVSNM